MCDCEPIPDIHTSKLLKTRTSHKCVECGEAIPKGSVMLRVTTLIEGHFSRDYTCLDCNVIVEHITKIDPDFRYCYGELVETMQEAYGMSTHDIEADAQSEGILSVVADRRVVKGVYSIYRLNVPWLSPRIGGKFKLAIDQSE